MNYQKVLFSVKQLNCLEKQDKMKITFKRISQPVLYVYIAGFRWNFFDLFHILCDIENGSCEIIANNTLRRFLVDKQIIKYSDEYEVDKGKNFKFVIEKMDDIREKYMDKIRKEQNKIAQKKLKKII